MMYLIDAAGAMVAAEISIRSAAGTTEIRGMYGGLHLAFSMFLVPITRRGLLQPALQLMVLVFGCVAAVFELFLTNNEGRLSPYT